MIIGMGQVDKSIPMGACMKESGKIIRPMEKAHSKWLMGHFIKEVGEMIANMGKGLIKWLMDLNIKDNTIKE